MPRHPKLDELEREAAKRRTDDTLHDPDQSQHEQEILKGQREGFSKKKQSKGKSHR